MVDTSLFWRFESLYEGTFCPPFISGSVGLYLNDIFKYFTLHIISGDYMSLYSFVEKEQYEKGEPHYSGIQLLALEVLLNEQWELK